MGTTQINDGNSFEFTYDSLGRKIKMVDPDLGAWNYKYDQNGRLISQSGGGGNLVTGDGYYRKNGNTTKKLNHSINLWGVISS